MEDQQRSRRSIPLGVVAVSAAVVAVGGVGWWTWHSQNSPTKQAPTNITQNSLKPSPAQQAVEQTVNIYWLKDTGKHLELVPNPMKLNASDSPNTVLEAAFNQLLTGPKDAAVSSTIPQGTKLRGVQIQPDGIHVNLSRSFTTGGGSASMTGRVAQVLYTATSLRPNDRVWIAVEGKPLETLGGEGLELDQPLTRQSFKRNFTL